MSEAGTQKITTEKQTTPPAIPVRSPVMAFARATLQDEASRWKKVFGSPALYLLIILSALALALSWQAGFNYKVDPAGFLQLDEPFLQNFNAREFEKVGNFTYRWSRAESAIEFPGIGKHDYGLRLQLQPGGNPNPNPDFYLYANETLVGYYRLEPGPKYYDFEIPSSAITGATGDLRLILKSQPFTPPGDPRQLGVVFMSGEIQARGGFTIPSVLQLGYLLAAVLLVYIIVARAGFGGWVSAGIATFVLAILVYIVATPARPWLTIFSDRLAFALFLSLLALVMLDIPLRLVWDNRSERAWVLAIFGLSLAVRFAGTLHPHIQMVDIGFHYNRFMLLWEQGQFFQKIESAEWGSRETYYPTTQYFVMGLFRWLIPDVMQLQKFWLCAFDASRALLVYYLIKRAVGDGRAGVIGAFLMAVLPVALISVGFGQVSNLYGEWLVLVTLCLVVVKYKQLNRWPYFAILTLTLLAAFIQHPGVIVLSGVVFLAIALLFTLKTRPGVKWLWLAYFLALALSIGIYHRVTLVEMVPQALDTITGKTQPVNKGNDTQKPKLIYVGGSVDDRRLDLKRTPVNNFNDWLTGGLTGFWAEARAYYNVVPLLMVPWAFWWLHRSSRPGSLPVNDRDTGRFLEPRRRLFWSGIGWFGTAAVFALLGWTINLYVRYSLFMLPFVAVGAGIFLSRLWQRQGLAVKVLVVAICLFLEVASLALWYDRIIFRSSELRP